MAKLGAGLLSLVLLIAVSLFALCAIAQSDGPTPLDTVQPMLDHPQMPAHWERFLHRIASPQKHPSLFQPPWPLRTLLRQMTPRVSILSPNARLKSSGSICDNCSEDSVKAGALDTPCCGSPRITKGTNTIYKHVYAQDYVESDGKECWKCKDKNTNKPCDNALADCVDKTDPKKLCHEVSGCHRRNLPRCPCEDESDDCIETTDGTNASPQLSNAPA
ncbi:hypothetical protein BU16DRAFT_620401 [Lophium mytilinum]|uniref:Uncharacterized protein n=1 Tax=Lophium mytilinum TaxID=390894 RepID=A0A6A6QIS7_9PEZI|nr:hypothetical protein BU16DRAFT_620401 [Lophium mytilinum]